MRRGFSEEGSLSVSDSFSYYRQTKSANRREPTGILVTAAENSIFMAIVFASLIDALSPCCWVVAVDP